MSITVLKVAVWIFLAANVKSLPLSYILRFYYQVITQLFIKKRQYLKNGRKNTWGIDRPSRLFDWSGIDTYVSPLEIDMYLHKSNSTYATDLDIARTRMMLRVFQKIFFDYHDNTSGQFKGKGSKNYPYLPISCLQTCYKKELKVFQRYQVSSRVLAWDQKWLFVLSKFTTGKNGETIHAFAVTKYVFKKYGKITIKPVDIMKECGLWSEEVEAENQKNYDSVSHLFSPDDLEEFCTQLEKTKQL